MSETLLANSAIMNTYNRFPLTIVKGKGSHVWTDDSKQYLDYTSGIATCNLGHIPEQVQKRVKNQLDLLWHCSNLYNIPAQQQLAQLIVEHSCFDKAFFCNSGAEANEAAIKIAKKYAKDHGYENRVEIVTFSQSFHGRTGSTMAATAQEKIHHGFTPLTPGFRYLTLNDMNVLKKIDNGTTAAVLVELVQGEGGVNPVNIAWIKQLEAVCKQHDILLMIDEIQTGIGRTGTLFAYEQFGIEPDVMTLAKGLGSGIAIGAMVAKEAAAASFSPGTHGSTFGGNPIATTAGIATLETVLEDGFLPNVKEKSEGFISSLKQLQASYSVIEEIRGIGLLVGVQMMEAAGDWVAKFREKGILILTAGSNVIRVLPPLTTTLEELEQFITVFQELLIEHESQILS